MLKRKKTYNSIASSFFVVVMVAIMALGGTTQAWAGNKTRPRITAKTEVYPMAKLTDEESRSISIAAGRVLKHAAQAMEALVDEKKDEALKHIDKGLTLLRIIENAVPRYKVKAEIKSGDITYKDEDEVSQRLVTIFDELEDFDIITPAIQAKKAKKYADRTGKSKKEKKAAVSDAPVVAYAGIEYTAMKLDTSLAKRLFERAKKNINNDKVGDSISDLRTIQVNGVIFEFDEVDLPLERAADNLKLAELELKHKNRHEEVRAALNAASDALREYEKLTGDHRSKEVRDLNREIDKLSKTISSKMTKPEKEKAVSKISGWWTRVVKWFK